MVTTTEVRAVTPSGQFVRRVDRVEGLVFTRKDAYLHARVFESLTEATTLCSVWRQDLTYMTGDMPLSVFKKRQRDNHTQGTFPMMELEETRSS